MARDQASESQVRAATPDLSTWLSANAGSGKTRVLTDRVARLLLGCVSPQNILCLTYTKAAASEMQNRLFKRLGEWSMKDDAALAEALSELGEPGQADLRQARQLFARAIETPGGLKIQTIHSFCSALLRRFPLESGVSPQFVEMDERAAKILRDEVVEDLAGGPDLQVVKSLASFFSGEDFTNLTQEIADHRTHFARPQTDEAIWGWFDLPQGFDETGVLAAAFDGTEADLISHAAPVLAGQSVTMVTLASELSVLALSEPDRSTLESLYNLFLRKADNLPKTASLPTKKAQEALGEHLQPFHAFMERVAHAKQLENSLYSAQKSLALHDFARLFLTEYEARKLRYGWLDFDDLIEKAGALLTDPSVAAWVLYRLDGGIDHILVDEAQDTSPAQWRVIDSLAREFTTGESAKQNVRRTLFVVGDPKQSIYSFQGADPAEFTRMKEMFGSRLDQVGQRLHEQQLEYSFRSSAAILNLVDCCLKDKDGLGAPFLHRAHFQDKPGRVDLWPIVEKVAFEEDRNWYDPVDRPTPQNHLVRLADQVADEIVRMLKTESISGEKGDFCPVEPGDVLILVRKRSGGLFDQIIRACKERALPIAGADRLRIGGELAVKDLTALLRFLATPEDDLSLAALLRSPLFGLSEGELFDLAHDRGKGTYLWRALSENQDRHLAAFQVLTQLRDDADFLRPYDLLERVLTRHRGRAHLLARLGGEAEDGIDALLSQALAYERFEAPSLTGFLMWLDAEDVTIKRQMDSAGNQIRVMTVHGAKGLESPIVFLPDTGKYTANIRGELARLDEHAVAWKPPAAMSPPPLKEALARQKEADREEWIRLLYVAMTRAEQWLIVAAAGDVGLENDSWYKVLEHGMEAVGAADHTFDSGVGQRYELGHWTGKADQDKSDESPDLTPLPAWLETKCTIPDPVATTLSPSDLGGAKALPGDLSDGDTEAALRRGRQIHRLLEFLPEYPNQAWSDHAHIILASGDDSATDDEVVALLKEVSTILGAPDLDFLFAADTLAEVDISAALPDLKHARIHGAIDRLLIETDRVLAVDFKSNSVVPDRPENVPLGLLRQMGAYAAALKEIFPTKKVETAILWTKSAKLMPLPNELVIQALRHLDEAGSGS